MNRFFIRTVVNNSGIDADDVSVVIMSVPLTVGYADVKKAINQADSELREEDDEGECRYNQEGWNASVLMDYVCEKHEGWVWGFLNPDMEITI